MTLRQRELPRIYDNSKLSFHGDVFIILSLMASFLNEHEVRNDLIKRKTKFISISIEMSHCCNSFNSHARTNDLRYTENFFPITILGVICTWKT